MANAPITLSKPQGREITGGDFLAQALKGLGVDVAFGIHGGHLDSFLMGCVHAGIRLVDTRHETCAVQAAEAYGKVTGQVGVAFITANSGFSNGLPGLATASADRNPVFVVTSSPPLRDAETNALQGFHDQVVVSSPLTKWSHRVTIPEEIPSLVSFGFRTAMGGAPGPVLIDLPIDVLFQPIQQSRISWGSLGKPFPFKPGPNREAITASCDLIRAAKRPILVTGSGGQSTENTKALVTLAELTGIPVFHGIKYGPALPINHPLQSGVVTEVAKLPYRGKESPDLIILIGTRPGTLTAARSGAILPLTGTKYIQVDVDATEPGRSLSTDLSVVSDSCEYIVALTNALAPDIAKVDAECIATATGLKGLQSGYENKPEDSSPQRIHPWHGIKRLFRSLEPGCILVIDGGECSSWAAELQEYAKPSLTLFALGHLGFLGNGYGYAIGAAVAEPSRQVVMVQGDGSAGFHFAELETFSRHNLNILTVVANNHIWGMSQHGQDLMWTDKNTARPVTTLNPKTSFEVAAQGFGNAGAKVDKFADIESVTKRLSKEPTPALLNLIIASQPIHPGTAAMINPTDDPDVVVVPYYDNLPRPILKAA